MPRVFPQAPDLAVGPDGAWAAVLSGATLRLYDLATPFPPLSPPLGRDAEPSDVESETSTCEVRVLEPLAEVERTSDTGRIVFLTPSRLLHVFFEPPAEDGTGIIAAELLSIPGLKPIGAIVRMSGAQRIIGLGPTGVVVAPNGRGADILHLRGDELQLQRTFLRTEVLSAIPAPGRRFLLEQRSGFELWDCTTRSVVSRLMLQTRQASVQIGFVANGQMLWALSAGPPLHIELFRASDGRRFLEMHQPGCGRAADTGPGRLLIAAEERTGPVFLDLDYETGSLQRLPLPASYGRLYSFAVRPSASHPEVLALSECSETQLLRISLTASPAETRLQPSPEKNIVEKKPTARTGRALAPAPARSQPSELPPSARFGGLRPARPAPFLSQRPSSPERIPRLSPSAGPSVDVAVSEPPATLDAAPSAPTLSIRLQDDGGDLALPVGNRRRRFLRLIDRAYDPQQSPAFWQWELLRWAERTLLCLNEETAPSPPAGGELQTLAQRLTLSIEAQSIMALLFATEHLLGVRPYGMRRLEILTCLGALHEGPALLVELLPSGALQSLGLVQSRGDGRLRLQKEVAAQLLDVACPELLPPTRSASAKRLPVGLYAAPNQVDSDEALALPQAQLCVDLHHLEGPDPLPFLKQTLLRALVRDAIVLLSGLPEPQSVRSENSENAENLEKEARLWTLRTHLASCQVPVVIVATLDAIAALELAAQPLPSFAK